MKKTLFQSNELINSKNLLNVKGGNKMPVVKLPPAAIINGLDGDETDKRNKRPGTSSTAILAASI